MNKEIKVIIKRLDKLEQEVFKENKIKVSNKHISNKLDFSLNERAFINKFSTNKFSGPEYFSLICSYLVGGKIGEEINLKDIKDVWGKCMGVMKGLSYYPVYSTRAKENGWVDPLPGKKGVYMLGKDWREILKL